MTHHPIAIVGDAPSPNDKGDWLLRQLLAHVGISLKDCYRTYVFREPADDVMEFCGTKKEGIPGSPVFAKGKYVKAEYEKDVFALKEELVAVNPNVVLALGGGPCWALLGSAGIRNIRGTVAVGSTGHKILPTYGPVSVIREWTLRPIVISDMAKAAAESTFPDFRRPERTIWLEPTLADLAEFERLYIHDDTQLSIDIETNSDQITCIGFAPSPDVAIVIPFHSSASEGGNYWAEPAMERSAWDYVRRWCTRPALFQNGLYDINFLWRRYGITVPRAVNDTMLLHHALQPEMQKGLGFMGSLYTQEASWKFMRKAATLKRED